MVKKKDLRIEIIYILTPQSTNYIQHFLLKKLKHFSKRKNVYRNKPKKNLCKTNNVDETYYKECKLLTYLYFYVSLPRVQVMQVFQVKFSLLKKKWFLPFKNMPF